MSNVIRHPYHLVENSPWPLISSLGAFFITTGLVKMFTLNSVSLMLFGVSVTLLTMWQWWRDISKEGANQGLHTKLVEFGLRWGMLMFIISEVCFFVSFFWAFFHSSLSPTIELGGQWPPQGIFSFHPFQVPLLNTIVLLSSGISVTWAHHALMQNNLGATVQGLACTVLLGAYFTFLQGLEYYEATFSVADSIYGTTFFVATGFHGFHVLVGTVFLMVCLKRLIMFNFSATHHFGFEAAAWYWHFVDVVWLFLYLSIYWWGNSF